MHSLVAGAVIAALVGWAWLTSSEVDSVSRPSVVEFSRLGDQPHLLVLSASSSAADGPVAARHALEQLAANHSWFLFITHNPSSLNSMNLRQFDAVVLNHIKWASLDPIQRHALQTYKQQGGQLFPLESLAAAQQLTLAE